MKTLKIIADAIANALVAISVAALVCDALFPLDSGAHIEWHHANPTELHDEMATPDERTAMNPDMREQPI